MKIIMHIDMNSFFATCEQQAQPHLRGKPIGVSGDPRSRTIVSAASIEAKKFGVKTGMAIYEARKLCPDIQFIRCDPDKYWNISQRLVALYQSYTEAIEVFSIDECFIDITNLRRDGVNPVSTGIKIAQEIKQRIRKEIGAYISCSIGIAPNKLMAKLGSEMKKPDGLTIIYPNNTQPPNTTEDTFSVTEALNRSELQDMCGIGRRTYKKLLLLNIHSFKNLHACSKFFLQTHFGKHQGTTLHAMARGIGSTHIGHIDDKTPPKSMGHAITLNKDTSDLLYCKAVILKLSLRVSKRMRNKKMQGRTVNLYIRFHDFSGAGGRVTINKKTNNGHTISYLAQDLLCEHTFAGKETLRKSIRLLSVTVSNLSPEDNQISLLETEENKTKAHAAMHKINEKFGDNTIEPLSTINLEDMPPDVNGFSKRNE